MTLATLGWSVVWGALGLSKLGVYVAPERAVYLLAGLPALAGVAYAVASVRARRPWLFMAAIALFANGSLLALPLVFGPEFREALAP